MADIKTHLRELSVAVKAGCLSKEIELNEENITPLEFVNLAKSIISNNIDSAENIMMLKMFNTEYSSILKNGFKLGKYLYKKFNFTSNDKILWFGNDTQKDDPVDLQIGKYGFSLKEDSFILENMGLYKFLSFLTNKSFSRGLHIFKEFANKEYQAWFLYTWKYLLSTQSWRKNYTKYFSSYKIEDDIVIFNFNDTCICKVPNNISNTEEFMHYTNGIIREKIFAKWISENLQNNQDYLKLKKLCSEKAGENVCKLIRDNLNPVKLKRLLQIRDKEYYYAKSTSEKILVFKVPNTRDFENEIIIESISFNVPKSQLNIETTLKNLITNKTFKIRNECRFSHGQFNGTPEAKMYYERNGDLSTIYTNI